MQYILVSSCLLGLPARYNGEIIEHAHEALARWRMEGRVLAFCPELAGGLPMPRPPAEIAAGKGGRLVLQGQARVVDANGLDVSEPFVQGAIAAQALVHARKIRLAVLKEGSPSCGSSYSYDGSFSRIRVSLPGVTTAALEAIGVRIFSETRIDDAVRYLELLERADNSRFAAQ